MKEIKLPQIGEIITVERGLELCRYFGIDYLVKRLTEHPKDYNEFIFDGASGIRDDLLGLLNDGEWELITNKAALPHDLKYAYGTLAKENSVRARKEKTQADIDFENDCISAGVSKENAAFLRKVVHIFGQEWIKLPWSWGFAHK